MKLSLNINDNLLEQFSRQLGGERDLDILRLDTRVGEGTIRLFRFLNSLVLYHFKFTLHQELHMSSMNPIDSDSLLLNINLSDKALAKEVNGKALNFQRYLPSGILYYTPNTNVASSTPSRIPFEIALIKFNKNFLNSYFKESENLGVNNAVVYEDLDVQSEELIRRVLLGSHKLKAHADLLMFLSIFYQKLQTREMDPRYDHIHPMDIKQLFLAASLLRNPVAADIPTIDDLARRAKMGKTKFKKLFKQVFGSAPKQYHQKIRMEYAKGELQQKQKTSSEIAYELGYAHPSKFTRAFKNYFGESPSKV